MESGDFQVVIYLDKPSLSQMVLMLSLFRSIRSSPYLSGEEVSILGLLLFASDKLILRE